MKNTFYLLIILFSVSSCKESRFIYYNTANITDHIIFPNRKIKNDSTNIFYFKNATNNKLTLELKDGSSFEDYIKKSKTVAFLVIQNDTIKY